MSNPFESFLRELLHGGGRAASTGEGAGGANEPHIVSFDAVNGGVFPFPGMTIAMGGRPVVNTGAGAGGAASRGRGVAAPGSAGRGRGSSGSIYTGDMPPMAWIQREQQRTPLRFTATDGAATFDSARLREEGNKAFKEGRFQEAVDLYTRAITADPSVEVNYTNRAFAYFKLGKHDESAKDANEAIRLKPDFFKGHYRLGLALFAKGDYQAAMVSLRRAQELAPAGNAEELKVAIAKCESKLARTPSTLLIADADTSSTASMSSPAPPADLQKLQTMAGSAAKARKEVAQYCSRYSTQKDIVECKERSQRVRECMAVATSGCLAELTKDAEDKQAQLRRTLKGHGRSEYAAAKSARDDAYRKAWNAAEQVQDAIQKLRAISAEEQAFFRRFGASSPEAQNGAQREEGGLAAGAAAALQQLTKESPLTQHIETVSEPRSSPSPVGAADGVDAELSRMLEEREAIDREVAKLSAKFAATDTAAVGFLRALQEENEAAKEVAPLLEKAKALNVELDNHARHLAQTTTMEISDSRLEDLNQIEAVAKRVRADKISFENTLAEGDALLEEEAKLEKERLLYERQRIQLQAEVEWFKVRDEPEGKIATLQNQVKTLQQRLSDTNRKQKEVQERILELVEMDHPELAWKSMASGSRILRLVKGSGLWLNLSLSDFQIVSTLSSTANSKVYRATRRGESVALKEISVNDEETRRRFQREVDIVSSCTHPNIMRIKGVFFDGPFAYIISPYYHRGSAKASLQKKEAIPWLAVQDMLRQLASGVAYLHERGIVHGDIKPSNVLLSDDNRPIIADFGIANTNGCFSEGVDVTVTATATTAVMGTRNYMAPEQLLGEARRSTSKSDIWALGLTFYELAANNAYFHDESLGEPKDLLSHATGAVRTPGVTLEIPPTYVGGDEKLADLIASMLIINANNRATAYEVLAHPYFSSISCPMVSSQTSAALAKSDERIDAVRSYIHAVRSANPQKILVSVSRHQMVDSLNAIIPQLSQEEMLEPIMVVFQGEAGIDEGALTSEMLNLFYVQMVRDKKALLCTSDSEDASLLAEENASQTFMLGAAYLPAEDEKGIPVHLFELLGKILLKSIVENRPLPLKLSSAILKYFCNVPVSILDLEEYDRTLADSFKRLRLLRTDELEAADLNFSRFSAGFLANHRDGKYIRETVVTVENVREYVEMAVQYEMTEKRRRALDAIKKGFYSVDSIGVHLKLLSPSDLLLLLCGVQHVPPQAIVDALEFQGFPASSKTPQHLKEILTAMSQNNLRRFLELCTSTAAIPVTGVMRRIKVLRTSDTARLPVGHGCVFQLDLPDYNDKQVLQNKLEVALAHVSDGFHIV